MENSILDEGKIIKWFTYTEVKKLLDTNQKVIIVEGYKVETNNPRYILFNANPVCVFCDIPIEAVALRVLSNSKPGDYGIFTYHDADKKLIYTKDHIMPRKRGGPDAQWNYQTMCNICNSDKGHAMPPTTRFLHPHTPYSDEEYGLAKFLAERFGAHEAE